MSAVGQPLPYQDRTRGADERAAGTGRTQRTGLRQRAALLALFMETWYERSRPWSLG